MRPRIRLMPAWLMWWTLWLLHAWPSATKCAWAIWLASSVKRAATMCKASTKRNWMWLPTTCWLMPCKTIPMWQVWLLKKKTNLWPPMQRANTWCCSTHSMARLTSMSTSPSAPSSPSCRTKACWAQQAFYRPAISKWPAATPCMAHKLCLCWPCATACSCSPWMQKSNLC